MPTPAQRSRSFRKRRVATPGGKINIHYTKKKPAVPKCGSCGKRLHGVPRALPSDVKKLPKSRKRPERPYGGNLCPEFARQKIRIKNMERWEND